jgi:glycosyltransferase involved in cell wall biosynthesis
MANTRFSIVTCSYQQGRFLESTIRSVLDQAYPELEYLVLDGGSTDQSVKILRRYDDAIAYWHSAADAGQTDALAKGLARARGDLMGWLCSDDLLLPGALNAVATFFDQNPDVDAVYGDALWIDEEGDFIRPKKEIAFNRFIFHYDHNYIPQPSMFWRRRLYERVGGLNRKFNLAMDNDLWDRFSAVSRIAHLPQYLSCMRYYPEQKTRSQRPLGAREDAEIRSRSMLARYQAMQPVFRGLARVQRRLSRLAIGAYYARVPANLIESLDRYRISGEQP